MTFFQRAWAEVRRAAEWAFVATREADEDDYNADRWREDYVDEPIRGRLWDLEDVEDMGGIDDGWLDD